MFGTEVNNVYYHYNPKDYNCYGFVTDTYYNVIIIIIIKYILNCVLISLVYIFIIILLK